MGVAATLPELSEWTLNHLLDFKWQSLLNSSFICQILEGEWKEKQKVMKVQILL